ncbi:nucleotide exchange factor GrpE [Algiphilus sp.]|uniref:nucleotide exchange factor GrpE n=1 Tax=Algiphilus sp. TaxID=1872431 RepID=UPI003B523409
MAEQDKPQDQEHTGDDHAPEHAEQQADAAAAEAASQQGEDELAQARAAADEYREQLLRVRAEAENQRKRMERENANAVKYAAEKVFRDLLSVADSLDLGLKSARESEGGSAVVEGIELTQKQLHDTLTRHGVTVLEPTGEAFDPSVHEAVSMVPSADVAPNHVLEVVQKGYCLHERVLRPARVVVASAVPIEQGGDAGDGDNAA